MQEENLQQNGLTWWQQELQMLEKGIQNQAKVLITEPRQYLLSLVSSCLLKEPKYYQTADDRMHLVIQAMLQCAETFPEYICQLAIYVRNQLYIRTTTNFILAFCAVYEKTKPFIEKYFNKAVLIPGDLIEVCQFAQIFYLLKLGQFEDLDFKKNLNQDIKSNLKFDRNLQRLVRNRFAIFNDYQLGKYCTDSQRKKASRKYQQTLKKLNQGQYELKMNKLKQKLEKQNKEKPQIELQKPQQIQKKPKIQKSDEIVQEKNQRQNRKKVLNTGKHFLRKGISKVQKQNKKWIKKQPTLANSLMESKYLTFKQLVTFCHIKEPLNRVSSILGLKYPKTEEEFKNSKRFQGEFDPSKAGQRMKIPASITWENELSAKGNKPEIWESLIKSNQVPYLALLRNLRNILKAGVNDECHYQIINKLQNAQNVEGAKIFPLQFFSAIEAVDEAIQKGNTKQNEKLKDEISYAKNVALSKVSKNKQMEKEDQEEFKQVNLDIANLYIEALNNAVKISVNKNLEEIKGHTVIFSDVSGSMDSNLSGGKLHYGSVRTCLECALVLGLMIKQRCQRSTYYIFSSPAKKKNKCYLQVDLPGDELKQSMDILLQQKQKLGGGTDFPYECIDQWIKDGVFVDNVIILSDMMISDKYADIEVHQNSIINSIEKYRNVVNPNMKLFSVDLEGYGQSINFGDELNDKLNFRIFGMSDSILKFISEQEKNNQVEEVTKYAINAINNKK